MIEISSTNNPQIKKIFSLKEKKTRNLLSLALIEGEKVVLEALELGKVKTLVVEKDKAEKFKDVNCEVICVPNFILSKLSSVENGQGVVAVIDTHFACEFKMPKGNFLVLDGVADPGNLGSIIRSAVAFGFSDIYAIDCVDVFNEKVLRSASGTFFKVGFVKTDYGGLERIAKDDKNYIISADLNGENVKNISLPKNKNIGVILGNEGNGISETAKKYVKKEVTIPMQNNVESLNVAVSGSVIMFEIIK